MRDDQAWVDPHCGYNPANCPYGDACADCRPEVSATEGRIFDSAEGDPYPLTREQVGKGAEQIAAALERSRANPVQNLDRSGDNPKPWTLLERIAAIRYGLEQIRDGKELLVRASAWTLLGHLNAIQEELVSPGRLPG